MSTMSYSEWKSMAVTTYDFVSRYYNRKVYESMVTDKSTGQTMLVQLTLRDVIEKCEHTVLEERMRQAVMHCVYTGEKPDPIIAKVMDVYYL